MIFLNEQSGSIQHIGEIQISEKVLLEWLHFEDGKILNIVYQPERCCFKIYLEHSEMPEVKEGDIPRIVTPLYRTTFYECGHTTIKRDIIKRNGV